MNNHQRTKDTSDPTQAVINQKSILSHVLFDQTCHEFCGGNFISNQLPEASL